MSDHEMNDELLELEASLRQLRPRSAVNRDNVVFRAGEQAMRRRLRRWQAMTAVLGMLLVAAAAWRISRPDPVPEIRYVEIRKTTKPEPAPVTPKPKPHPRREQTRPSDMSPRLLASSEMDYYRLQRHLLRWGFDGLPSTSAPPPSTSDEPSFADLRRAQPVRSQEPSFLSSWLISFEEE